jgi:hypothetical protein
MAGIVVFHVLMLLVGLGIGSRVVPENVVRNMLGYLHGTIGITAPSVEQARTIALVWIGAVVIIVDGCLFVLVWITSMSSSR